MRRHLFSAPLFSPMFVVALQAASSVGRAAFSHLLAFHVFGNSKVLIGEIGCFLVLTGLALYASCR